MTIPTVPVTVTIADQNGSVLAGAKISAILTRDEVYGGFVVPNQVVATTNASGIAVLNLFPNQLGTQGSQYIFKIVSSSGKALSLTGTVPNAACNLENIVNMPAYSGKPDGQLAIDAAIDMLTAANDLLAAAANVVDGNTVLYGPAIPTTEGIDGNFYINTASNMLYGPKAAGAWPAGTSLIGPAGATGAAGAQGVQG
ncbi:MAG: hypothetical protein Q7U37_08005, partial [Gallionella sp.]|nr:hypothetical protein [Gallionella sp.]